MVAFLSREGHVSGVWENTAHGGGLGSQAGSLGSVGRQRVQQGGDMILEALSKGCWGSVLETSIQNPNMMDEITRMVGKEGQRSQVTVFISCLLLK